MQTYAIQLPRIHIVANEEPMTFRANVGKVEENMVGEGALQSERPALRIRITNVFIEYRKLTIVNARCRSYHRQLRKPIRCAAPCDNRAHCIDLNSVGAVPHDEVQQLGKKCVVADLVACAPNCLPRANNPTEAV